MYFTFKLHDKKMLFLFFCLFLEKCRASELGQACSMNILDFCGVNEACVSTSANTGSGVCRCATGYTADSSGENCLAMSPDDGDGGGSGTYVATVLIIIVIFVLITAAVLFLNYRYNILVPIAALCPSCQTLCSSCSNWTQGFRVPPNLFGVRSGRSRMMDDMSSSNGLDDDPIA